jgi:4a-hydroxytetrahydrobiopterin dehydratase
VSVALLQEEELAERLPAAVGWIRKGNSIIRTVVLPDFMHAMGFVQSVAMASEKADHHPDISIHWNTVVLTLTTHQDGGLTEKDIALAIHINSFVPSPTKE